MNNALLPVLVFSLLALALAIGMWLAGVLIGPRLKTPVKQMPYESGMDPIHDARRRFDVRFHLVAVAFLVFDVELVFLYPWAVALRDASGLAQLPGGTGTYGWLVLADVLLFIGLLAAGLAYVWRKGLFRWR
ncbi:MAG: NADH-quinone oxidoreductase subunit A [Pirellulaceae bacterium]|nr:MAG: NADH-quinone oxidoreductase subunit A [Pirellulaceae bacterium]